MKLPVRVSRAAQRDLAEIDRYLSIETPEQAAALVDELLGAIEALGRFPLKGARPRDARLRRQAFRFQVVGRYSVFYKVNTSRVMIYRVLHQRRGYAAFL